MRWIILATLVIVGALSVFLGTQYHLRVEAEPEPAEAVNEDAPVPVVHLPPRYSHTPSVAPVTESKSTASPPSSLSESVATHPASGSSDFGVLWQNASKGTTLAGYTWGVSGDDDLYDGGADFDTLEYYGARADYEIVRSPLSPEGTNNVFLVRKKADDSLDIVFNIEQVVFADQVVLVADLFK